MKPHRLIPALLVAASAAVAACAIEASRSEPRVEPAVHAMLAVGLAQVALLAAWVAWGRRFAVLRIGCLVAAIVGWAFPLTRWNERDGHSSAQSQEWMFVLGCYAALIVVLLWAMRLTGLGAGANARAETTAAVARRRQFSLWQLISGLTAAAVLCGFWIWLRVPWSSLRDALTFAGLFGALATASLLIGGLCRKPLRMILLTLAAMVMAGCVLGAIGAQRNYVVVLSVLCGYLVLAMQALHAAGLRLIADDSTTSAADAESDADAASRHAA